MQALPPSGPTPLTPSPLVPMQQAPLGSDGPTEATALPERAAVPAQRPEFTGRHGLPAVRTRVAQPDAVVFTAACPACGADCDWTEQREDTRMRTTVTCSCV